MKHSGKPRFIILCSEFPPEKYGGIALWAKNLIDTLVLHGYDAIVLTHLTRAHKKLNVRSSKPVRYINGHDWKKLHWFYRLPYLIKEFLTNKECVIIAATWDELQFIHRLKPLFGFRILCSSHGTDMTRHVYPVRHDIRCKINSILASVDLFLPVSQSLDRLARSSYPALNCSSIILGCNVNTGVFRPEFDPSIKKELKQGLGFGRDNPIIMSVGRMMAVKGFRQIIMALPAILERVPDTRYVIVARPLEPECILINQLIGELGLKEHVIIHQPVANEKLPRLLQAADIFALTSEPVYCSYYQEEGLPRVIPEASACGLPVVVSTTGGLAEAVVEGKTGFIIHHGDLRTLADRITLLLADPELRRFMGVNGRKHVEKFFSDTSMTDKILSITRTTM